MLGPGTEVGNAGKEGMSAILLKERDFQILREEG